MENSTGSTTRREFLQGGLGVAGAAVLGSQLTGMAAAQPSTKRPNLLFIYTEGQRADAVGISGNPILKTPNMDRIGREGMRFTNAFCTNALCAPARATALTGLYSKTSGALDNKLPNVPLPSDIPLFTDMLHDAGYEVAIVGKIHVRNGVRERYWDYYFGFNAPATNYYNPRYREGRKGTVGEERIYPNQYADDLATDRALAWLKEEREKPFCLLLWLQTPHAPFYRPRRYLDTYANVTIPKPDTFDDDLKGYPGKPKAFVDAENKIGTTVSSDAVRSLDELAKDYYTGLLDVDDNIGRVLQHLEHTSQLDDTAIMFTSDHGYFLGEWRCFDKRFMHEPSIRVPMMMRYPKRIPAATVRQEMILDIDIAPTLLDFAGIDKPKHMLGKSILDLAHSSDPGWRKEWFYDYYEYPGAEQVKPHRGIRTERYKLMHYYLEPQEFEMYDLQEDPGEKVNLYGQEQYAALQQELTTRLQALATQIPERQSSHSL